MTVPAEVTRLKNQLDATFERAKNLDRDAELHSDFSRYLCVLVSGYIEKALIALIWEHAKGHGKPTLQRFVARKTKRFSNPRPNRIRELLGDFDQGWEKELEKFLKGEPAAAINSIVTQRNQIVHGETVGITYLQISTYYRQAQRVIDRVAELCAQ